MSNSEKKKHVLTKFSKIGERELRAQIVKLYKSSEQEMAYKTWYNCTTIPLPPKVVPKLEMEPEDESEDDGGERLGASDEFGDFGKRNKQNSVSKRTEEQNVDTEASQKKENEVVDKNEKENAGKSFDTKKGNTNNNNIEPAKDNLTKEVIKNCPKVYDYIEEKYKKTLKNKFELLDTDDVAFRMLPYVFFFWIPNMAMLYVVY